MSFDDIPSHERDGNWHSDNLTSAKWRRRPTERLEGRVVDFRPFAVCFLTRELGIVWISRSWIENFDVINEHATYLRVDAQWLRSRLDPAEGLAIAA